MESGKRRHLMTHQTPAGTSSAAGQLSNDFTTLGNVYGSIRGLSGKEIDRAQQMKPIANKMLVVRYERPIYPKDRLLFLDGADTRIFNVVSVIDVDERHIEQWVMVQELAL